MSGDVDKAPDVTPTAAFTRALKYLCSLARYRLVTTTFGLAVAFEAPQLPQFRTLSILPHLESQRSDWLDTWSVVEAYTYCSTSQVIIVCDVILCKD